MLEYERGEDFKTVEEMDEALITNWNSVVTKHDTVFILGDVSFHNKLRTASILFSLNGNKTLIEGNHDRVDKNYNRAIRNAFNEIAPYKEIRPLLSDNTRNKICMFHYPLLVWNKCHKGSWHLHGHSHGNLTYNNGKMYDVGVDNNNYYPVSLSQIETIMSRLPDFKPLDHHES